MTTAPRAERSGSPRTLEEPMAFTGREFLRGAIFAVLSFALLFPIATLLPSASETMSGGAPPQWKELFIYLLLTTGYSGLVASIFCALVGAPLAFLLGRRLRHQANTWLHRLAFMVLGLLSGALGAYVVALPFMSALNTLPGMFIPQTAIITAVTVCAGWEYARSRALREDTHPRPPRPTLDEDFEDRAIDSELRHSTRPDASPSNDHPDTYVPLGRAVDQ